MRALVTGGASGIGLAVARRLAADGHEVTVIDQREAEGFATITADLADRAQCLESAVAAGPTDILINNAGFQHVAPLEDFDPDVWDRMIALMLSAPFLFTQQLIGSMKAAGWGRVINMASIHGLVASPFKSAYVAAKHGLVGLTKVTALEGGEYGVTANAICPAYVRTPLVSEQVDQQAAAYDMSADDVIADVMLAPAAIKRLIEPEEVAAVVSFLCSDDGASVTGATWSVDLGWTAR